MSRLCSVINCASKSPDKESHRTLFKLSAESKDFKTWLNAIGSNLREGRSSRKYFHVCDLHFDESCLERTATKIIKDGAEVTLPRQRLRLRPKSVPTVFPGNANRSQGVLVVDPSPSSPTSISAAQTSSSPTPNRQFSRTSKNNENITTAIHGNANKCQRAFVRFPNSTSAAQTSSLRTSKINAYTTTALLAEWNSRFPNGEIDQWGVVNTRVGLIWLLVDGSDTLISRLILIKEDMTVELRARGHVARFPVVENITCLQDMLSTLIKVGGLQICEGSNNGAYCKDGFFQSKPTTRGNRCKACQLKHKQVKDRERKRAKRAAATALKEQKFRKNIKRKYERSERKAERLKEHLQELRARCAAIKEESKLAGSIPGRPILI